MSLIPPEDDYQEYCKYCHEYYVPHWTNCNCPELHVKRDLTKVLEKVEQIINRPKNKHTVPLNLNESYVGNPGSRDPVKPKPTPGTESTVPKTVSKKPKTKPKPKHVSQASVDEYLDKLSSDWFDK